jgi:Asp/Glu/hydantoin racemase
MRARVILPPATWFKASSLQLDRWRMRVSAKKGASGVPLIGILGWEAGHEDTLSQLEQIAGNTAHRDTFGFPVKYKRVKGAYYQTVVVQPNAQVLESMIQAARELEQEGIRAIATSCGFNAIFQRELANAVGVLVFASSLIQVPLVHRMLKEGQRVGIITADREHLTEQHLEGSGITRTIPVAIRGVEATGEFSKVRTDPNAVLDVARFQEEVVGIAKALVREDPHVGAIVLECTDLPPFAAAIRRATGLPVFDIVTLTNMIYEAVAGDRWVSATNGREGPTDDVRRPC